ncbi:Regulator of chromosome condensation 1/beta-lactamase-inhibitor protein II [Corchorus olitorius]|uniref:Regulator of chromosome condensation 1/beta-lactamase-inhibitor protein II n=1 Tax=Corchorus olitorius TaxID=93759 RepID=A0A1R3I8K2_9ROSI|nr:Regulator of chromosome condensation 1/beta-lactamase-inhibitor protein II [Corchorus olitorius]
MHCWRFSSDGSTIDFKRIYNGSALNQLEAGNSQICGLNATNGLECWQWHGFNPTQNPNFSTIAVGEGFVCGLSSETGKISCLGNAPQVPQEGNYSVIAAGFGHVCAITLGNDLQCWGNSVGVNNNPEGKFMGLALGLNRSCALRTNETVVCWGHQNNFSLPMELEGSQFITIKAKRNVFCGVLKLNYTLSCWGDTTVNSNQMVFPEVMPGPCKNSCPCGSYGGSGSFCNNGESICQPCPSQTTPPQALPPTPSPQPQKTSTGNDLNGKLIAFLVVGCVGCSCLLLVVGFFVFRYCKGKGCRVHDSGRLDDETGPAAPQNGNQPQISQSPAAAAVLEKRLSQLTSIGNTGRLEEFSLEELLQATENFSEDQKIGTGSFGSVYHGRKAIHMNENGMPRNVVDFVVPYIMQDEIHRVLDPRVPPPTPFEIEAVAYVGYLAADCVVTEGRDRPSMTEVVNSLDKALAACLLPPQPFSRSNTDSST